MGKFGTAEGVEVRLLSARVGWAVIPTALSANTILPIVGIIGAVV
jgi:hypothetical protein